MSKPIEVVVEFKGKARFLVEDEENPSPHLGTCRDYVEAYAPELILEGKAFEMEMHSHRAVDAFFAPTGAAPTTSVKWPDE